MQNTWQEEEDEEEEKEMEEEAPAERHQYLQRCHRWCLLDVWQMPQRLARC